VQSLLETDVPPNVQVVVESPDSIPPIRAHYDTLVRGFRNLVRNALEAMESVDAPRLVVTLRSEEGRDGTRWLDARIRDYGTGLPEGGAAGIFEPDFTTKKRGTGLGLALVRQAVEAHGGEITAHHRDPGAEFVVRLPIRPVAGGATPGETDEESV
jgi:signal transduction histidine kinase